MKINERCPLVGGMALCMQRSGAILVSLALAFWMWCSRMVSGNRLNYTDCTKESLIAKLVPLSCLRFWCCVHETCYYASGMSHFAAWVPDEKREMFLECLSKVIRVVCPQIHFSELPDLTSEYVSDPWVTWESHIDGVGGGAVIRAWGNLGRIPPTLYSSHISALVITVVFVVPLCWVTCLEHI